jgi:5-oxoprolinase (ATP-hydrolysing)
MVSEKIKIAIDRGGTFTDCIGSFKGKEEIVKLLSVDPNNYDDAPLEGIRRLLEKFTGKKIAREEKLDTSLIGMSYLTYLTRINSYGNYSGYKCFT